MSNYSTVIQLSEQKYLHKQEIIDTYNLNGMTGENFPLNPSHNHSLSITRELTNDV